MTSTSTVPFFGGGFAKESVGNAPDASMVTERGPVGNVRNLSIPWLSRLSVNNSNAVHIVSCVVPASCCRDGN